MLGFPPSLPYQSSSARWHGVSVYFSSACFLADSFFSLALIDGIDAFPSIPAEYGPGGMS
jgi:hypothetical protein